MHPVLRRVPDNCTLLRDSGGGGWPDLIGEAVPETGDDSIKSWAVHSYLTALELAWARHFDIAFSPDHVWFTFLTEVAGLVKDDPAKFAHLFTTTPDQKQEVTVINADPELIDVQTVVNALKERVPTDVNVFLPTFSTATNMSRMACHVAFCDAVSPFYNYSMMLCREPKALILGTDDDWEKLLFRMSEVCLALGLPAWGVRAVSAVQDILDGKPIFSMKECGSGHQSEVRGAFARLFYKQPKHVAYVSNFPTGIAEMRYKNLTTGRNFLLRSGIFGAGLTVLGGLAHRDAPILTPTFEFLLYEEAVA